MRRGLLQAGREVDGLAGGEGRLGGIDDHLARLDPDPGLQLQLGHGLENPDPGADGVSSPTQPHHHPHVEATATAAAAAGAPDASTCRARFLSDDDVLWFSCLMLTD